MTASTITDRAISVSGFIRSVRNIPAFGGEIYAYRGEANINWDIGPGIMRRGRENLLENEKDAIRDLISVHPNEFLDDDTMFDKLVRMQHFGLPTRLMDVTANPLVALFNATEDAKDVSGKPVDGHVYYIKVPKPRRKYFDSDTISCVANLANLSSIEKNQLLKNKKKSILDFNDKTHMTASDRLVQFISLEKPAFRPIINPTELDMLWYVIPKLSNRRIIAQNGAFLIFGLSTSITDKSRIEQIEFSSIRIPYRYKSRIRDNLKDLGITESSLFPEIDKAAKLIESRYCS